MQREQGHVAEKMRGTDSLPGNNQFFPKTSSCQKAKDQISGGWSCILLTQLKSKLLLSEMGKSAWQRHCSRAKPVPCHCWAVVAWQGEFAASQAGAVSQLWHCWQTWCLVSLSTGVSTHHAWKIPCPGIHYSEGGMAEGLTLLSPYLPRSCFCHLGFSCVVFSHLRMQQVLPDGSRGHNFNWCHFYIAVKSVQGPGCFLPLNLKAGGVYLV